ncbi:MAG: insulinase family protein [Terriglobales bacterium]|jgi:zinc protease
MCEAVLAQVVLAGCVTVSAGLPRPADAQRTPAPAASRRTPAEDSLHTRVFPYEVFTRTLANGLHVVIIPTPEFKDMVTYATVVFAGSGSETERGKTGLAHLFEHEMFLHEYGGVPSGYQHQMRALGTHNNAYTNYDVTFFHPTTFTSNLVGPVKRVDGDHPGLIDLEASRFTNLTINRKAFEVEAGAVLGEYRRIFSFPTQKMIEVASEKAFPGHPYGHTVIGYLDDVEKMPQAWDAAWEFYHRYYQPDSLALIIVGDVQPKELMPHIESAYAKWKSIEPPAIPPEADQKAEVRVHVPWEADVAPHVMVGYHTPASEPGTKETAVAEILNELLVSPSAPLYQKLRYQKQTVTSLYVAADPVSKDPHWLLLDTELVSDRFTRDGSKYADDVQQDLVAGIEDLKHFSKQPNAAQTLAVVQSRVRNDLLASLDSTESIANLYAAYYKYKCDPEAIDKAMAAIRSLTPADIDAYAGKYFTENRRVVATLWHDTASSSKPQAMGSKLVGISGLVFVVGCLLLTTGRKNLPLLVLLLMAAICGLAPGATAVEVTKSTTKPPAAKEGAKTAATLPIPRIVTLPSSSPLYIIKVMFMTGSVDDPVGKEGLAKLTAKALLQGGFGDPKQPVTKERLAEITRPWGSAATPTVTVDKQTTTFSMEVPKEVFPQFIAAIMKPVFSQPLFEQKEIDRLRTEQLASVQSGLRFEEQETLGLEALEGVIFQGTPMSPPSAGTVQGLKAIERSDLLNFYKTYYTAHDAVIATSADAASVYQLKTILPVGSNPPQQMCSCLVRQPRGRDLLIVTQPNAIATGIHFGFPITVNRLSPDYWPLFVANAYLGLHRDDFGRLYQEIRQARGYNYGDYSYIEYLSGRPHYLFPPPATPRSEQYFSVWIRPVAHQYAHFVLKAATAELARFIDEGLTAEQVAEAKIKARTLYLNYAESTDRQLGYRLDDTFYGLWSHPYLPDMLNSIDAVTTEQVNAAIRNNLQVTDMHYVITTNENVAEKLADDIANDLNCTPKTAAEYRISDPPPPEKVKMLAQDQQWISYPLGLGRENIHIVKSEQLFETSAIPGVETYSIDISTPPNP